MSTLDDRLREAIDVWQETCDHITHMDETIADIKQAFQDAGYVQIETPTEPIKRKWDEADKLIRGDLLTGQEWYDRFVDEFSQQDFPQYIGTTKKLIEYKGVMQAAKRAAGLADD